MAQAKIDKHVDWKEPERENPVMPDDLPNSSDNDFWGKDATRHMVDKKYIDKLHRDTRAQMRRHKFESIDGEVVCVTCPYPHSLSVAP